MLRFFHHTIYLYANCAKLRVTQSPNKAMWCGRYEYDVIILLRVEALETARFFHVSPNPLLVLTGEMKRGRIRIATRVEPSIQENSFHIRVLAQHFTSTIQILATTMKLAVGNYSAKRRAWWHLHEGSQQLPLGRVLTRRPLNRFRCTSMILWRGCSRVWEGLSSATTINNSTAIYSQPSPDVSKPHFWNQTAIA